MCWCRVGWLVYWWYGNSLVLIVLCRTTHIGLQRSRRMRSGRTRLLEEVSTMMVPTRRRRRRWSAIIWAWRPAATLFPVIKTPDLKNMPRLRPMSILLEGGFNVSPSTMATTDGMSGTGLSGSSLGRLAEEGRKHYRKEMKKHLWFYFFYLFFFFSPRGHCF